MFVETINKDLSFGKELNVMSEEQDVETVDVEITPEIEEELVFMGKGEE